jgi:hypothetical protein
MPRQFRIRIENARDFEPCHEIAVRRESSLARHFPALPDPRSALERPGMGYGEELKLISHVALFVENAGR